MDETESAENDVETVPLIATKKCADLKPLVKGQYHSDESFIWKYQREIRDAMAINNASQKKYQFKWNLPPTGSSAKYLQQEAPAKDWIQESEILWEIIETFIKRVFPVIKIFDLDWFENSCFENQHYQ